MELLPSSAGAPAVPRHLMKRIKSLSDRLEVRFYPWAINPLDLRPLVKEDGNTVECPCWNVFVRGTDNRIRLLFRWQDEEGNFLPFDERLVKRLEGDSLRNLGIKTMLRQMDEAEIARKERGMQKAKELRKDFLEENKQKIRRVAEDPFGSSVKEDTHITSYGGQTNRSRVTKLVDDSADYIHPDYSKIHE